MARAKGTTLREAVEMAPSIWRTISILGTIIAAAIYLGWQVSNIAGNIDKRFLELATANKSLAEQQSRDSSELRAAITSLAKNVEALTADKIGRRDLELFCAKAQIKNRNWICPYADDVGDAQPMQRSKYIPKAVPQ